MKKLLLFLVVASIALPACRYTFGKRVRGNGNVKTEERSVGNFHIVSSQGPYDIHLVLDSNAKVRVEAEDNLLPYIETYVDGDVLHVRTKEGYWLRNHREIRIYVSAPSFTRISSTGSGNVFTENKLNNSSPIEFSSTGSGNITADLNAPEVKAEVTGSGNIQLNGETKTFTGEINGSGNIKAFDLRSETANVDILGSGNASVFASMKLKVEVMGSGDVNYKGGAQVSSSVHGSGNVRKVD